MNSTKDQMEKMSSTMKEGEIDKREILSLMRKPVGGSVKSYN